VDMACFKGDCSDVDSRLIMGVWLTFLVSGSFNVVLFGVVILISSESSLSCLSLRE